MDYECVIGLEVHTQLKTHSKMFCACPNHFTHDPNTNVCPVCLGLPGSLPVINRRAVELGLRAGLALNCEIPPLMKFDRKHYYYPDLPKNIQISQFDQPLAINGALEIILNGKNHRVNITRAHLEEDAGKLLHSGNVSNIDLNRTGTPLLEIVSEPDIRSPQEARLYLEMLRLVLLYNEISDCNMEEGSLRCDANISVRKFGDAKLGVKNEIKNMNSFRGVENALTLVYRELCQQMNDGETIKQVTWGYNIDTQKVFKMRTKEDANDYRYFPEPDLPPLSITRELVEKTRGVLAEMPLAKLARLQNDYQLSEYDANLLVSDKTLSDYFEQVNKLTNLPKETANWIINEIAKTQTANGEIKIVAENLAQLISAVDAKKINMPTARKILQQIIGGDLRSVAQIIEQDNLAIVSDTGAISTALQNAIAKNEKAAEEIRNGKTAGAMWFVGQIMQELKGKANPETVTQTVAEFFNLAPEIFAKKKK